MLFAGADSISILNYIDDESRRVYLIDTPGFGDTSRLDVKTLELLGTYLSASYAGGICIHGVIFLQRITYARMSGSSVRSIDMLRAMCDLPSYSRFALVTTMWPGHGRPQDHNHLARREEELRTNERFFGNLISKGAVIVRHVEDGTGTAIDKARSARRIVSSLLRRGQMEEPMVLPLRRELVDEGKTLEETLAGQSIRHDICKAQEQHALDMQVLRNELAVELRQRSSQAVEDLRRLQEDLASTMASADSEMRDLRCAMKEMHEREQQVVTDRIAKIDMRFRQKLATKSQELADLEDSVRLLQEDAAQQTEQRKRAEQEGAEREMVKTRRAEMEKSVYQPLVITQATVSTDSSASPTSPTPLPYTTRVSTTTAAASAARHNWQLSADPRNQRIGPSARRRIKEGTPP